MTTRTLPVRTTFTALTLLLATACGDHFGGAADDADASTPGQAPGQGGSSSDPDAGMKAQVVTGTPTPDSITEAQGIFVSPNGSDTNAGTRAAPFATLQAAITAGAKVGKIVFACTGTYAEALVVSDSISIIGGLDCTDPTAWKTGAAPSKIQSPTSPAATAKAITSMTRLEALDIIAPDATAPGASSIGFFADHSPNLTVVNSTITAGNGANGTSGADGIQLTPSGTATGGDDMAIALCGTGNIGNPCVSPITHMNWNPSGGAGGSTTCLGGPNPLSSRGGVGGAGGVWQQTPDPRDGDYYWASYQLSAANNPTSGAAGTGAGGVAGNDGPPATEIGSLTADGYVPSNGNPGSDGSIGSGGRGGDGGGPQFLPQSAPVANIYVGARGAGGGAGGCPGLAGTAGTGGGASLGVALLESPIVLDGVTIKSAGGGLGGLGTFGSDPSIGGQPGANLPLNAAGTPLQALAGGNGGVAGVSTNGSNGPSIGVLVSGTAPTMQSKTTVTPGTGAPAINERTHTAPGIGVLRTIPATPAGIAVDMKTL